MSISVTQSVGSSNAVALQKGYHNNKSEVTCYLCEAAGVLQMNGAVLTLELGCMSCVQINSAKLKIASHLFVLRRLLKSGSSSN